MQEAVTFDVGEFMERAGNDRALAEDLVGLFLPESPRLLDRIRKAAREIDSQGLASAAHALRGSLAVLAATRALKVAMELETIGKEGDMSTATSMCDVLDGELGTLCSELNTFLRDSL